MHKATTFKKNEDTTRNWIVIDATDKSVGRVATVIANRLLGKYQPDYTPHVDSGDHVVVINMEQARLSGNKTAQKTYFRHTGYPGGIKETKAEQIIQSGNNSQILTKAVYGMLPANKLKAGRMSRLHVFNGSEHTHSGQKPKEMKV